MIKNNFSFFQNREERADFVKNTFKKYIDESEKILDVGCSENELKNKVGDKVFGIDISGKPDKRVNLEEEKLDYFDENSYDFIICTEVLEHLDNFYEVLDDMKRVTDKYILISLPNCPNIWRILRILIFSDTGKFYRLPQDKPADRHKWFFSLREINNFFSGYCQENNFKIKKTFTNFNYSNSIKGIILKSFLRIFPIKLFAQSYWVLIEKNKDE